MESRATRRLRAVIGHVTIEQIALGQSRAAAVPCVGETSNQSAHAGQKSSKYTRDVLKIVFSDPSAKHERYGGSGDIVVLEGEFLRAHAPSETVVIFMHPSGILNLLPMPMALARAGIHVITATCRYPNNDTCLIMEKVLLDLGAFVRYAKDKLKYTKVVLAGWSGGGSLVSYYQSQAERPTLTHTPAGDPVNLTEAKLPPADGLMLLAAHSSRARVLTEWLDPAVLDEQDPSQRDVNLDIFNRDGPKAPFSSEFIAKYSEAQIARNRRITAWVKTRMRANKATAGCEDWRQGRLEEAFTVHCTQANLARLDLSIDSNNRELTTLAALADENHSPAGLARFSTLRSWLSQWSWDDSNADAVRSLRSIKVPCFVLENGKDELVLPSHCKDTFNAVPHTRKKHHIERNASHYYMNQPDVLQRVVETVRSWLECEELLASRPS